MDLLQPLILSVTLMGNGDLVVIERPRLTHITLEYCQEICDHTPAPVKKIYRAQDGKIVLFKEVHQVPVKKLEERVVMEFPE